MIHLTEMWSLRRLCPYLTRHMLILHAHAHGLSFAAAVENVACGAGRRGGRIDVVAADVVVVAVETVA
jgi:hypothetical protein